MLFASPWLLAQVQCTSDHSCTPRYLICQCLLCPNLHTHSEAAPKCFFLSSQDCVQLRLSLVRVRKYQVTNIDIFCWMHPKLPEFLNSLEDYVPTVCMQWQTEACARFPCLLCGAPSASLEQLGPAPHFKFSASSSLLSAGA